MSSDIDAQFDAAFADLPDDPDDAAPEAAGEKAAPLDYSQYTDTPEGFRSGFVSFVGRPNTGKSTLTNALVGQRSPLPRTSRKRLATPSAVWFTARTHRSSWWIHRACTDPAPYWVSG